MKKKIFFQFFIVTLLSVLLMFIFGIVAVNVNAKTMIRERLEKETELACSLIQSKDDFQNFSRYEKDDAFRITIVDLDGNVLYESDTKSPLENHVDREEIKNAINNNPKAVERFSETFGANMTYYALKTTLSSGEEIIVRLAIKSSQINGYLFVALPILVAVLIVSLIASLIISNVLSNKISGKIVEVGESLKSLNKGAYKPIIANSREIELYSVLNEINELNESTHAHIQNVDRERDKLNTVLENVSQGIVAIDENKKIVFANKSVSDIFGSNDSVTGKDLIYLIDDIALCEKITRHLGENYQAEYVYKEKELSVCLRVTENHKSSGDVSSIVIITDITKEKAIQKQKSDFFANASHELKTPVTVMQGLSELLLAKDGIDEVSKKQLERIHKESLRLADLISDMLKLSNLERGEENESEFSSFEIRCVVEEVVSGLSPEMKKKNVTAKIDGNAKLYSDLKKVFEIVENLCSNAVHYNKENGKIYIDINSDGVKTVLKISDTGIGIKKEHLPRLCERFYRVDKSRSKKTGGTGLGLAIVKHICATLGAEFSIESEFGIGTTATIVFNR